MNITIHKPSYATTEYYSGVYETDDGDYEFTLIYNQDETNYFIDIQWLDEVPINESDVKKEIEIQWLEN